jgi:Fur family transcriptional regulator, ferric uptake regulator
MVAFLPELQQHLKEHGYSLTKPRLRVFQALQGSEPQTMHELVVACDGADRASVYRTVTLFEQIGVIQRLQIGWKYKLELSDAFSHHHHHVTCLKCGRIVSFDESAELQRELAQIAANAGFAIKSHQIEIQGLCPACKA